MALSDIERPSSAAEGPQPMGNQDKVNRTAAELRRRLGEDARHVTGVELVPGKAGEYHIRTTRAFPRQRFCDKINTYSTSDAAKISASDIQVYSLEDAHRRQSLLPGAAPAVSAPRIASESDELQTMRDSDAPRVFVIKEFYLDMALNMATATPARRQGSPAH